MTQKDVLPTLKKYSDNQFLNQDYGLSLKSHLKFELQSFLGRLFFNNKPKGVIRYLNIGSGTSFVDGILSIDFYRFRKAKKDLFGHDLRFPLPIESEKIHGVFSEHTLEHLYPFQALTLLKEVYRVLEPGGVLRCTVPDLEKYIRFYNGENLEGFEKFASGCDAIWSLTQNYDHRSVWDYATLSNILTQIGFRNVQKSDFGQGQIPKIILESKNRKWETLYVEAQK